MNTKENNQKRMEVYPTKDMDMNLDDKENEEKLFNEYYKEHSKENVMNVGNESNQKSENDISKEIDNQINSDHNLE